jgi:hypothetical protein
VVTISWAYIYEHEDTDPVVDRTVVERAGQRTILVPVPTAEAAPAIARRLVDDDGVGLIELCGGFSIAAAAKVAEAVGGRVPVGHVSFAVDSVPAAARFNAAFESAAS